MWSKSLKGLLFLLGSANAGCPYFTAGGNKALNMMSNPHTEEGRRLLSRRRRRLDDQGGRDFGVPEEGFDAVREDIRQVLTVSKDFFPADFEPPTGPNYGGEFG